MPVTDANHGPDESGEPITAIDGATRSGNPLDVSVSTLAPPAPVDPTAVPTGAENGNLLELAEEMFHRAMELPLRGRASAVREWCGDNETLRREVLQLLDAHSDIENAPSATPARRATDDNEEEDWSGGTAGRYRLLRQLGHGGMGVVYLGELSATSSGAVPVARPNDPAVAFTSGSCVAIKFVRRRLRGSPALEHFLLERDTLASLQHPNISCLLDGGLTDEGIPFVVMEYIQGRRLDEVCDDPNVNAADVTRLMIQLCDAVAFVHRNLVLHRDLKPGNVMVSDSGQVKLLDFGTLKILGPAETESAMTQAGMRPLTRRYAAPEHVLGDPVTTMSDVYSLGVVLYRILAGRLPPGLDSLTIMGWFAHIREKSIEPPSSVSKRAIPAELAADLDAITLKAMRFDPLARYASAQAMAEDLRRALNSEPVTALADNRRYRFRKFYSRHRAALWSGAAAAGILLAGIASMAHETEVAHAEQGLAQAGVEQERELAHTLLGAYFDQLRELPGSTNAQKRTVTDAVHYLDGLTVTADTHRRAESTREIQMDQIAGYTTMASVLGSPYEDNLGETKQALAVLDRASPLADSLAARYPNDTDVLRAELGVELMHGNIEFGAGHNAEAILHCRRAVATADRLIAEPTAGALDLAVAASAYGALADQFNPAYDATAPDVVLAENLYGTAIQLDARALALEQHSATLTRSVAVGYYKLALLKLDRDPAGAAALDRTSLDTLLQLSPEQRAENRVATMEASVRVQLGELDVEIGKAQEGLKILDGLLIKERAAYAADPTNDHNLLNLAVAEDRTALAHAEADRPAEAAELYESAVTHLSALLRHDPTNRFWRGESANNQFHAGQQLIKSGNVEDGKAAEARGLAGLLMLCRGPDATESDLSNAVDSMNIMNIDPFESLALAKRLMQATPTPDFEELSIAATAADRAGDRADARQYASAALAAMRGTVVATSEQRDAIAAMQAILRKP